MNVGMIVTGILVALIVFCLAIGLFLFYEILGRDAKVFGMLTGANKKEQERAEHYHTVMERIKKYGAQEWNLTSDKGKRLVAYYVPAKEESDVVFVLNHGYRGNFANDFAGQIFDLYERGYHLLLLEHQASKHSEGKYITFGHRESEDELLWLQEINNRFSGEMKLILYGISMGSATVLMLSGDERLPDNVSFVIGDCGYTNAYRQIELTIKNAGLPCPGFLMALVNFWAKCILHIDFRFISPIDSVKRAKVPILFVHGDKDLFVPTYMVEELYDSCTSEKEKLLVAQAEHGQSYMMGKEICLEKIDAFIEKYART